MARTRSASLAHNLALAYALLITYACLHPLSGWRMSGLPLDLLIYRRDELRVARHLSVDWDNPYFDMIHKEWGASLRKVFNALPDPDWSQWPAEDAVSLPRIGVVA